MSIHLSNCGILILLHVNSLTGFSGGASGKELGCQGRRLKRRRFVTSLVVKWLRLHAAKAGGAGLIRGQGTEIPHVV